MILDFLKSEMGYGICAILLSIALTAVLKRLIKDSGKRKKFTPLITLGLGIVFAVIYQFVIAKADFNPNDIISYTGLLTYALDIALGATGLYVAVKRIFSKVTENDTTVEDLFETAGTVLPQALVLIASLTGGDIATAENVYAKVKELVKADMKKGEKLENIVNTITTVISGWTSNNIDVDIQAKLLVESVQNEIKAEELLAEKEENKVEEDKEQVKEENKETTSTEVYKI